MRGYCINPAAIASPLSARKPFQETQEAINDRRHAQRWNPQELVNGRYLATGLLEQMPADPRRYAKAYS